MAVDTSGARRKLARASFDNVLPKLVEDAGAYISGKLVQEVLNGASGTSYPKPYPTSVADGEKGFVGVITSNLRRSIGVTKIDQFTTFVSQINEALAPYHGDMIAFSQRKYGMNFYQIAVTLYGPLIAKEITETLIRIARDIDAGKESGYSNPFPA